MQKEVEQRVKDYPARVKDENVRFATLQKAFVSLNKVHQGNQKETQGLMAVLQDINPTKEWSQSFLGAYSTMADGLKQIQDEQGLKATRVKDLVAKADQCVKGGNDALKEIQDAVAGQTINDKKVLLHDLKGLRRHKVRTHNW